jgi:hypothetical protein
MTTSTDPADKILEYLKSIYPKSATKEEILKKLGMRGCSEGTWFQTLLASRDIEVTGKKYRYAKK